MADTAQQGESETWDVARFILALANDCQATLRQDGYDTSSLLDALFSQDGASELCTIVYARGVDLTLAGLRQFFAKEAMKLGVPLDTFCLLSIPRMVKKLTVGRGGESGGHGEKGNYGRETTAPATIKLEDAGSGVLWQKVAESLEGLRLKGEVFKSQPAYAEQLGCSPATVNKAIDRTPSLKEWSTRPVSSTSWGGTVSDVVLDSTPQTREADPAEIVEPADADVALAYLIDHASPEERARIHAMPPDQQRRLAELAYRDPDCTDRILEGKGPHSR